VATTPLNPVIGLTNDDSNKSQAKTLLSAKKSCE
jgi:hypothetical protein